MIKLKQLLEGIEYEQIQGDRELEITSVEFDSRKIQEGCLFLCIKGANFDGHRAALEAVEKGAKALVVERDVMVPKEVALVKVKDSRYAMAFIAAHYFGNPSKEMKIIGITGTKGKTTTTYLVKSILESVGRKVGLIGTIEVIIGDKRIHANNTTPDSFLLQSYFRQMADCGCDTVVMEVSSQGLMLHRTQGFLFDFGIFTNLEPDHIGPNEHSSFEEYMECKSLLFRQCKIGIVNRDDPHWERIVKGHTCQLETFGLSKEADIRGENLTFIKEPGYLGVDFHVRGKMDFPVQIGTPGRFSVYNALAAISVALKLGCSPENIKEALLDIRVPGRSELVSNEKGLTIMIDYAHTPESLEKILSAVKIYTKGRVISVFGCGGDRDKNKRPMMGEASGRVADYTIITSDNPRSENPEQIVNEIEAGMKKTKGKYECIVDRKEAIKKAIEMAHKRDMVIIAGKGHELTQEIKGKKYPFDEREIVKDILAG